MSGSHGQAGNGSATPPGAADPSMEDILASIRRILSEDDANPAARSAASADPSILALDEAMLVREPSRPTPPVAAPAAPMPSATASLEALGSFMTAPTQPDIAAPQQHQAGQQPAASYEAGQQPAASYPAGQQPAAPPPAKPLETATMSPPQPSTLEHDPDPGAGQERFAERHAQHPAAPAPLIGPEATAASTAAMGNLLRTLQAGRNTAVHRGGPTIEDVMREEMRPMLKQWLDTNLPGLVERVVRTEIERVSGRVTL